ncbi:hypothetical protein KUCAC02_030502 [Chaenocephalus aceratus]|uniref:Uncharacterized protein n=1 Tax=Chaenocephalus aceratus TaxID=36190 RepID=A0ACB9XJ34_CHAAC|nr:hypothetical protein KUCAC02_030502 [Chaenocephalus aceratus]
MLESPFGFLCELSATFGFFLVSHAENYLQTLFEPSLLSCFVNNKVFE